MHARGSEPESRSLDNLLKGEVKLNVLRVGEMGHDCLISYESSMMIYERLMISSDPLEVQVCSKFGSQDITATS